MPENEVIFMKTNYSPLEAKMEEQIPRSNELQENYTKFSDILAEQELDTLFKKYGAEDIRHRKLSIRHFFGLLSSPLPNRVSEAIL